MRRQLLNEALNQVLKRSIRQRRPDGARMGGNGMPSAHAQFIAFFAAYVAAYTLKRMGVHRQLEKQLTVAGAAVLAAVVCYSRVRLGYHSVEQVVVGAAVGAVTGLAWHAIVAAVSRWCPSDAEPAARAHLSWVSAGVWPAVPGHRALGRRAGAPHPGHLARPRPDRVPAPAVPRCERGQGALSRPPIATKGASKHTQLEAKLALARFSLDRRALIRALHSRSSHSHAKYLLTYQAASAAPHARCAAPSPP